MVNQGNKGITKQYICPEEKCTGCSLCKNICPQKCIEMKENQYGELHPVIDESKCIKCGLCRKSCIINNDKNFYTPMKCFAGWRKNENKRKDSSSGGIAMILSEYFIKNEGIVYGVEFEHESGVRYTKATTIPDLDKYKGSKYAQADIQKLYNEIFEDLKNEKKVLFIASPCQIAGINAFFNKDKYHQKLKNNLLTIDFLCHGSVNNKYLLSEIKDIEKTKKINCDAISFRSNDLSKNYYFCLTENNKLVYKRPAENQRYFYSFLHSIITKECCMQCKYKRVERVGDITIGDFIGLDREVYNTYKIDNPSVILINNEKGNDIFNKLDKENFVIINRNIEEAIKGGPSFRKGNQKISKERKKFRKYYPKNGYTKSIKKAVRVKMKYDWYISKYIKKIIHKIKHKILGGKR